MYKRSTIGATNDFPINAFTPNGWQLTCGVELFRNAPKGTGSR